MDKSDFLNTALNAVKSAEEIILHYFDTNLVVDIKSDLSPVTKADKEAEQDIINHIRNTYPSHGFLGEEMGKTSEGAEYIWVIDPIDGTKNYIRKLPFFSTQLALMHRGEIILGVSNAPLLNELLYAEKDKGAYLGEERQKVSEIGKLEDAYVSYGGIKYFENSGKLNSLLELGRNTRQQRGLGDSWSYHLLAKGQIDVILEAYTRLWDIAAVKIIVEEAGGRVTDFNGGEIEVTTNAVVASNAILHDKILAFF